MGCCLILGKTHADPFVWSSSAPIDNADFTSENVATAYDTAHNKIFAAWIDLGTNFPTYSIYENGSWSVPALIDSSMTAMGLRSVYLVYDSQNDRIFASWTDISGLDYYPSYSIYSGGSWSASSVIDTTIPVIGGDVFLCYNSIDDSVFATWGSNTGAPVYSMYSSGTWSTSDYIDAGGSIGLDVYTCFNSLQNEIVATWGDIGNGGLPAYSIYNGSSWSLPQNIGISGSTDNVFPCYNSLDNQVVATWADALNSNYPTYSVYNGTTWSDPSVIASSPADGIALTLFSCYDSTHNQIFVAWPNPPDCDPLYSIYSNGSWSAPAFINVQPPGVFQDIFLTYNPIDGEVFATWTDCVTGLPYYSIYADTQVVDPPTNLEGQKRSNRFATQKDLYNLLSWNPPLEGEAPVLYRIYRDNLSTLIGTVSANAPLRFEDHNRKKGATYTYYITSVNANGNQSVPASITIF